MWSRNARPVATLMRPRPSRATFAASCVSFDFRAPSPALLKAHLDRMRVGAQTFQLRQPNARLAQHLEIAAVEAEDAAALQEGMHAKRRAEACGARRRQRVIRAGHIIAER